MIQMQELKTCTGRSGSLDYEIEDANTYAEQIVDYLKYNNCFNNELKFIETYQKMSETLNKIGKPIFYSICHLGEEEVAAWARRYGDSWRTTGGISDNRNSMLRIIDLNDKCG